MDSPKLTVEEASNAYANAMRNPPLPRPGVCPICKTFHDPAYQVCFSCSQQPNHLDAFAPITYSVAMGQMHHVLRSYKDDPHDDVRRYHGVRLTAILWRFIEQHEPCLAKAAGVERFDLVTTVPSKTPQGDERRRGLRTIVGLWCTPIADRWERSISPTDPPVLERTYSEQRYVASEVSGQRVLLIDDTWTTGAAMQSAAFALRAAGASSVAGLAIGRHLNLDFSWGSGSCEEEYRKLPATFDWDTCALHRT